MRQNCLMAYWNKDFCSDYALRHTENEQTESGSRDAAQGEKGSRDFSKMYRFHQECPEPVCVFPPGNDRLASGY